MCHYLALKENAYENNYCIDTPDIYCIQRDTVITVFESKPIIRHSKDTHNYGIESEFTNKKRPPRDILRMCRPHRGFLRANHILKPTTKTHLPNHSP